MIQIDMQNGALSGEQIRDLVTSHKVRKYADNMRYYNGDNPTIVDRVLPVINAPNYKLPVSYARKIVKTIVGYMFKPGLITYNVDDERYNDLLHDIFYKNNEDTKSSALGRQAAIQGIGFELHYTHGSFPYFAKIPVTDMIVVYDYAIEPEMIAAIRYFRRREDGLDIEVYYDTRIERWFLPDKSKSVVKLSEEPHEYDQIPLVVYENNEEWMGDFEPIKPLIDAYDLLLSDSMNEFDRFAWAYLILKNMTSTNQDATEVKYRKIIELFGDGDAKFLQKEIPSEYIRFMSEWIRKEIHKQTHVPDFTDTNLGTQMSGAAIDRMFYDFEFLAADKEDRFRDGLKKRIDLINTIISKTTNVKVVDSADVNILMDRNKPQMLKDMGETAQYYSGMVSQKTLLENFAPFVADPEEEIDRIAEEQSPYRSVDDEPEPDENIPEDTEEPGEDR